MKEGVYCMCVLFYLCVFQLWCCNVLTSIAPLDVPPVPHADLIMCPRDALSPVGKEEIPGVGGSLSCEKSKWEATAMDSLWRLCLFLSFWTAQRASERKRKLLCSILMVLSGHHLGVVTSWFLPHSWDWTLMRRGAKVGKDMKDQIRENWINA